MNRSVNLVELASADGSGNLSQAPNVSATRLFGSETSIPSTAAQREIFSASLTDPVAGLGYNHSISIFLGGAVDRDALFSALLNLLHRHEALRGRFSPDGNAFLVRERIAFEMPVVDLRQLADDQRASVYANIVRDELNHVFDLLEGPLFRAMLIVQGEDQEVLLFNCHHAVVDGWSLKIILEELPRLYSDLACGRSTSTLPRPSSFIEYLRKTEKQEREQSERVRAFWREVFSSGVPVLDLPLDHPRPSVRTFESLREDFQIDSQVYERIKAVGAKRGLSQFVTLLSAFALYISRLSGQRDFLIGVPAAGQITSGKSGLLGHDARVMPIRCLVEDGDSFAIFARRMMERFLAAYEHQWITIPELLEVADVEVEKTRAPLVAVMFNFDPGLDERALKFDGLSAHHFFNHRNAETFELSVNAVVESNKLVLEWAYNRTLFDSAEMHLRLQQLERLMASIVEQPDAPVETLELVPSDQIATMDEVLNRTAMDVESDICVEHWIRRSVNADPDKVAVECGPQQLTYRQLWRRSGQLAAALLREDLGSPALVGVMLERSTEMVAALLAVWRSGAAFVPLDPAYPPDRLQYMIEQSGMRVLLTDRGLDQQINGPARTLYLSDISDDGSGDDVGPDVQRQADDLAYVIYTSGSTGKPKGVQVPQGALVNFLASMGTRAPGITAQDRLLAVTTLSFDIAELELWLPLVFGATTIIADRSTVIDGSALMRCMHDARITFLQATPSTWRLLLLSGWQGDQRLTGLCGGEAMPRDLAQELLPQVGALWNVYGPTETTVWSTIDRITEDTITIGKPIGNTQAYVLDAQRAWVPRGSIGELWLGGLGVTQGYLGRDDLTRERFLPNPFSGNGNMYRTGDLVKLRRDGRLEYIGRNDFQVKVRGYRIELGEVQLAMTRLPKIRQSVVVVRGRNPAESHLVGFYVLNPGETVSAQELRMGLKASLPDYMVPSRFVELQHLPLTDNGKINLKALPDPFTDSSQIDPGLQEAEMLLAQHPQVAAVALMMPAAGNPDARPIAFVVPQGEDGPSAVDVRKHLHGRVKESLIPEWVLSRRALPLSRGKVIDRARLREWMSGQSLDQAGLPGSSHSPSTENEVALATIWRDILNLPFVGIRDNFFDLGGNSLLSIQMLARLSRQTGYQLTPRHVVVETLAELAKRMVHDRQRAVG